MNKWYTKTLNIIILFILFFPVGLFLMWKYATWNKSAKIAVSAFIVICLLATPAPHTTDDAPTDNITSPSTSESPETTPSESPDVSTDAEPEVNIPDAPLPLKLTLEHDVSSDGKLSFTIATNLPDGTEGMVTISNDSINYYGSNKFVVTNGVGTTESFSLKGNAFPNGTYTATLSFASTLVQKESVQPLLGEGYSNYISEYITDNIIQYTKEIVIEDSVNTTDYTKAMETYLSDMAMLYDEITSHYASHTSNFDPTSWAAFRRDLNSQLDAVVIPDTVSLMQKTLPTNLKVLANKYGQILQGRGSVAETKLIIDDINSALNE